MSLEITEKYFFLIQTAFFLYLSEISTCNDWFLRYTFAGGLDGYMEIFKSGEYGNLLERMETPFTFGIDAITSLRPNLLLLASSNSDEIK